MLTNTKQEYWDLFTNPLRFAHESLVDADSFDPLPSMQLAEALWPANLQWQTNDFEAPSELVWLLTRSRTEFSNILICVGLSIESHSLMRLISRRERDTVRDRIGTAMFELGGIEPSCSTNPGPARTSSSD